MEDLREELGPFASRQIWLWRMRLGDNRLLANWADQRRAEIADRMNQLYIARNAAVHNGVLARDQDRVVAHSGLLLLDVALEVLEDWIPRARGVPAGRGLDGLDTRARHVLTRWSGPVRRSVDINLAALTAPGGDGLGRS